MNYLVDTNVISALAPTKNGIESDLAAWLEVSSSHLYLSVVTAAEIYDGIAKASRMGATRKAETLGLWWQSVEHLHSDRILPFDMATARVAGEMTDKARGAGYDPGFADVAIAATARIHGLILLTRNVRHFSAFEIAMVKPFDRLPIHSVP